MGRLWTMGIRTGQGQSVRAIYSDLPDVAAPPPTSPSTGSSFSVTPVDEDASRARRDTPSLSESAHHTLLSTRCGGGVFLEKGVRPT